MFGNRVTVSRLLVLATVFATTLHTPAPATAAPGGAGQIAESPVAPGTAPFDRQGMWIWYVSRSDGGSPARMIARAKRYGIGTLYIKAGDGGGIWSQFSSSLVESLHRGGLDVCAWQFVYGDHPLAEAKVGAAAVRRGADCLVIDAEGQYEGKYAAADLYVRALRGRIGESFPLSLAAFPYVDYHPSFPYSVFFGPGGATYNQPQMYWKAIETSVRAVFEHTYLYNRVWAHPIYPLGQTYGGVGHRSIVRFRRFAQSFGGLAPSWWDWQETSGRGWGALGATTAGPIPWYTPEVSYPLLKRGSRGDLVLWAQEHLQGAGQTLTPLTGIFDRATVSAVKEFQAARGLAPDGQLGTETWQALLTYEPVRPTWTGSAARRQAVAASRAILPGRPRSASIPATGYEIDPGPAP